MAKLARFRTFERRIARRIVKREAQRQSLRDNVRQPIERAFAPTVETSIHQGASSNDDQRRSSSSYSPRAFSHSPATLYSFPATDPARAQRLQRERQSPQFTMLHPLRRLRAQRKLTLEDLAQRSGLSPSYLSRLEAGARRLNVDTINRLAEALECDPRDLLAEASANKWETPANGKGLDIAFAQRGSGSNVLQGSPFPSASKLYMYETHSEALTIDYAKPIATADCPPELLGVPGAYALLISDDSYRPRYQRGDQLLLHPGRPLGISSTAVVVAIDHTLIVGDFLGWTLIEENFLGDPAHKSDRDHLALELRPLCPHLLQGKYSKARDNAILLYPSEILSVARVVSASSRQLSVNSSDYPVTR